MNEKQKPHYPLRHLSIRVPWHDTAWSGQVCIEPLLNDACLKLKNIADNRDDALEESNAGKSISSLREIYWPPCVAERSTFMAPFEFNRTMKHPYNRSSAGTHGHFEQTPIRYPAFSAAAVPFRWMLSDNSEELAKEYGLKFDIDREPELDFETSWVQELDNQRALTNCFFDHICEQKSLVFFYTKKLPFIDSGSRRVIVGIGFITHVQREMTEYRYSRQGPVRSGIWERTVQHSIRPPKFENGFLMPYHEAIRFAQDAPSFDPATVVAFAPEDRREEFAYGSEHVSHDGAIASILSCIAALNEAKDILPGNWEDRIRWLNDRLAELWTMRGPYPGLGSSLSAFGVELGSIVAMEIESELEDNQDPWTQVDKVFQNPTAKLSPRLAPQINRSLQLVWKTLPEERKALLKLISRLELTPQQAKLLFVAEERENAGIKCLDKNLIENPYLMYELTRRTIDPVSVWTVDRGIFPEEVIRVRYPLPDPSALDGSMDGRRVRALIIHLLEEAALNGHTLQTRADIIRRIRKMPLRPECDVTQDSIRIAEALFKGVLNIVKMADGHPAYQLYRLSEMSDLIRKTVEKRLSGKRHIVVADWRKMVDDHFKKPATDAFEQKARLEKAAALKELAESRFSVLIGPAGTGKTTLLTLLCDQKDIAVGGVLLLAPTGKARVKLKQASKHSSHQVYTVAQFLNHCDRYDNLTQQYKLSTRPPEESGRTVIVDEASMLTEEMMAALLDSLKGCDRLIMVGDHRQLPPIGPGRPFVDIINRVAPESVEWAFPKVSQGYAELTVKRRQMGAEREDMRLAEWFSGTPLAPGEDDIFGIQTKPSAMNYLKFIRWEGPVDFNKKLDETLVQELGLSGPKDETGFASTLGATIVDGVPYFNKGAASSAEDWQILSPVHGTTQGVFSINRRIHQSFRDNAINFARERGLILRPLGIEEIIYGDKVINIVNHSRTDVFPTGSSEYIANGEIGIIEGQFKGGKIKKPWLLEVEFSSQPEFKYSFKIDEFKEEGEAKIELAYALTVHKVQGSEFKRVILVLPNPCRLLSRELLYTALTRHTDRLVILHQGDIAEYKKYSSDSYSETARRLTNLFEAPKMVEIGGTFFEDRLINRTSKGEAVRSKSEVIIADRLSHYNVSYTYEKALTIDDVTKYPDFTIEDEESGQTYYWEHLGMLQNEEYEKRWKEKLAWYKSNGIVPYGEEKIPRGVLIISKDTEQGGISSQDIDEKIATILKV